MATSLSLPSGSEVRGPLLAWRRGEGASPCPFPRQVLVPSQATPVNLSWRLLRQEKEVVHVSSLSLTRGGGHDHTQQPWPCASSLGKEGQIGVKFRPFSSSEKEEKVNMAKVNMATLQRRGWSLPCLMQVEMNIFLYMGEMGW